MAKADRLERLDNRRIECEAEYRAALIEALERTAAGKWGLFDHQRDRHARAAIRPTLDHLAELGEEIDAARDRLGLPAFALQQEFLAARGPWGHRRSASRNRRRPGWRVSRRRSPRRTDACALLGFFERGLGGGARLLFLLLLALVVVPLDGEEHARTEHADLERAQQNRNPNHHYCLTLSVARGGGLNRFLRLNRAPGRHQPSG